MMTRREALVDDDSCEKRPKETNKKWCLVVLKRDFWVWGCRRMERWCLLKVGGRGCWRDWEKCWGRERGDCRRTRRQIENSDLSGGSLGVESTEKYTRLQLLFACLRDDEPMPCPLCAHYKCTRREVVVEAAPRPSTLHCLRGARRETRGIAANSSIVGNQCMS